MKCAASDDCTTSTAWMRAAYSWPTRWNTRSPPVRSTRTAMGAYFASKARATFSAAGRSSEVYQTTLPSFLAASIRAGVTELAGGAAARTEATKPPAASAAVPLRTWRLESLFILFLPWTFLVLLSHSALEQTADVLRQIEPDRCALGNVLGARSDHT